MINLIGYDEVNAVLPGDFPKLPAGGYVCRVCNVELTKSKAGNTMLIFFIDVAEGEFTGHFRNAYDRVKNFTPIKWDNSGTYRQLVFDSNGKISRFFKGLLTCFQQSNSHFSFKPDAFEEQSLRGLLIGFVFAEEEYQKPDGSTASRVFPKFPKSISDIQSSNFKIPDTKKIQTQIVKKSSDIFGGDPVSDLDLPF